MEVSTLELQPIISVDDQRNLQVRDEISPLEQQQQQQLQLYDCDEERIGLQKKIGGLLELVDNSGVRLQQLEDDISSNAAQLRPCLQKMEKKKWESAEAQDIAKLMSKNLAYFETIDKRQKEQMAKLSAEIESLESKNTNASMELHRSYLKAKAIEEEIKRLQMELVEQSNCKQLENMNISQASESNPSGGCELQA